MFRKFLTTRFNSISSGTNHCVTHKLLSISSSNWYLALACYYIILLRTVVRRIYDADCMTFNLLPMGLKPDCYLLLYLKWILLYDGHPDVHLTLLPKLYNSPQWWERFFPLSLMFHRFDFVLYVDEPMMFRGFLHCHSFILILIKHTWILFEKFL